MKNRERLIIYPLLAIIALAAFLDLRALQAQREPGEATFRKLTIVDERGKKAISLSVVRGIPHLEFIDENGKGRMNLALYKIGPVLSLFDENGKGRMKLGLYKGSPALALFDENGKMQMTLEAGYGLISPEGKEVRLQKPGESLRGTGLSLFDENGKGRMALMLLKGEPSLRFFDENGKVRMGLVVDKGEPVLLVLDQKERPIWRAP